jgi:hypothetical protein
MATITEQGVYQLSDEEYFADPVPDGSLSSTGVRLLLSAPAKFRWAQEHPEKPKRTFDIGHAAHQLVLGAGPNLVRIDADEWRTNAIKAVVAGVREVGAVPLKPADWDAVHAMADVLRQHPLAPKLFTGGEPEQALIWRDQATGVMCRAKVDWLRPDGIVDYKSAAAADEEHLRKTVHSFGYFIQDAFYRRGFRATHPGVEPFFVFVAQEKEAPYLVTVFQLTDRALAHGDRLCDEALRTYRDCTAAGVWPGYPTDEITDIDLPAWVRTEEW